MAAHQQAVGVDAVGGAGDEGEVVLLRVDLELGHLGGEHDADLVDLVGDRAVEDGDSPVVAGGQLVKVGKEPGAWQAAVAGDGAVGPDAADGEARPREMADGDLQHGLVGAVVDGQGDVDFRDVDVAHDAGAVDIQQGVVFLLFLLAHVPEHAAFAELFVVLFGGLEDLLVAVGVELGDRLGVARDGTALVEAVPPVGEGGIDQQPHPDQRHEQHQQGDEILF